MKAEAPTTSREEPRVSYLIWRLGPIPCFNSKGMPNSPHTSRGGLSHLFNLEWNPLILLQGKRTPSAPSAQDKSRLSCTGSNGTPSIPRNRMGGLSPLLISRKSPNAPHELDWSPDPAFDNSRGMQSSMPQHQMRPDSLAEP